MISVVIPAYNEETNIRLGAVDKVSRFLENQDFTWEIIIVNDGSDDRTERLLDEIKKTTRNTKIIHNPHQGKAATVITGMKYAKGDIVLFSDLDQATPLSEIKKLLPWFSQGYDVVIGSRSGRREGAPLLRLLMARGFMLIRGYVLGLKGITDTQCGFKAFRREVVEKILSKLKLYGDAKPASGSLVTAGFDLELLYVARTSGFRIKEVPVNWHYVETRRVNPVKDSIYGLIDILKIKLNSVKGVYK